MSEPRVVTTREAFLDSATAVESPDGARIPVEVCVAVDGPLEAYRRVRSGPGSVLLETTGERGWGYIGVDPVKRLTVWGDATARSVGTSPTLSALAGLLDRERLVRGSCSVPYPCGVIGWLSYDVARELESLPDGDDGELPRLEVAVYDRLAAWRSPGSMRVTACPRVDGEPAAAYERGRSRALELARALTAGTPDPEEPPVGPGAARFESECGRSAFVDRVRTVKERIRAGATFQANVSHRLTAPATVGPVAVYAALRSVNPAPYSCLLEGRAVDLVGASPELLLERNGDRVRTEPIAGTAPRGETAAEDETLEATLRADEKERAEHAMLVDLERNDLGAICAHGSVEVEEYRRVDRYASVMHLVSSVTGQLRPTVDTADAIAAVFPGGTITGAPKPRTMAIIDEVEATRRGPYTGSVGIWGFDDRMTMNIVIRTLTRVDSTYHLRVGAGIVHDSDPDEEYDETLDKARGLLTAVDSALEATGGFEVGWAGD